MIPNGQQGSLPQAQSKIRRIYHRVESIAVELKDVLYQTWPGMPRDHLEDLFTEYFVGGLQSPETKVKLE